MANAYSDANGDGLADDNFENCTGNRFVLPGGWADCGPSDSIIVTTSTTPTPSPSPQGLITGPYPDLVVTDISSSQATSGTPFTFTATIKNLYTACVSSHITGGGTFYAAATVAGSALQIYPMAALACIANPTVGETYTTGVFGWTPLNVSSPTTYTVRVCADTGSGGIGINGNGTSSNVEEINEGNNCTNFPITVSPRGTSSTMPPPPSVSAPTVVSGKLSGSASCVSGKPVVNLSWSPPEGYDLSFYNFWNIFRTYGALQNVDPFANYDSQVRFNRISDTFIAKGTNSVLDPAIYSGTLTSFTDSGPTSAAVCNVLPDKDTLVTCPNVPENTTLTYNALGLVTNGYSTQIGFQTNPLTLTTPDCSTATPTPTMTATCQLLYNKLQSSLNSSCGASTYDKVADINKDQSVNINDISIFGANTNGGANESACQSINNNTTNPCSTPTPSVLGPGDCSVSLTANGADNTLNVPVGGNVTLAWSTTGDIDNILTASGAWSGNIPAPGSTSQVQGSEGSSTRTLTCIGANGVSHSDSITVTVGGTATPAPVQKQLVRITLDGQQIYPSTGTPAKLDLLAKQVFDMVITYTDTAGVEQTVTKVITFVQPAPTPIPTPTPASIGPTCQLLLDKIQARWGAVCGNSNYDPVADVNKDRAININDFSYVSANNQNETLCQSWYNNTTTPCKK